MTAAAFPRTSQRHLQCTAMLRVLLRGASHLLPCHPPPFTEKLYSVRVQLSTSSPEWMSQFLGGGGLQGMANVLHLCSKVPSLGLKALDAVVSGLKGGIKMQESLNAIAGCEDLMHGMVVALTPPEPRQGAPESTDSGAPSRSWLELRDRVTRQLLRIIAVCCTVDGDDASADEPELEGGPGGTAPPYVEQGGTADVYDTLQDGFAMAMSSQKHPREFHGLLSVLDGTCFEQIPRNAAFHPLAPLLQTTLPRTAGTPSWPPCMC